MIREREFETRLLEKAARTQALTGTNYDVGSTTWADLRVAPLQSAMKVANLGHEPSWPSIDPIQVSTFPILHVPFLLHFPSLSLYSTCRCGMKLICKTSFFPHLCFENIYQTTLDLLKICYEWTWVEELEHGWDRTREFENTQPPME